MHRLTTKATSGRLAVVVVLALVASFAATVASAASSSNSPAFSVGSTSVRVTGMQRLYRINQSTQRVTNVRRVTFRAPRVFSASNDVSAFGNRSFVQILSGRWAGWWIAAPGAAPANVVRFDAQTEIRLAAGTHVGSRFYADGTVRTRRPVSMSASATFPVSRQATFNGRSYFLVADGPLADRWVPAASSVLVQPATSEAAPPTTQPTPAPTTAPDPLSTWKGIVLVYSATDVTYTRADGSDYHLQVQMSSSMHSLALDTVNRFGATVHSWSGGMAAIDLDIVEVPHAITTLDRFDGAYWVGPEAIAADLETYAPSGTYDSIFVIWQANDAQGERVPVSGWGLTLPPGPWANGAGFTSITTPPKAWWWTDSANPEEVFVHEWMHQVIYFEEGMERMSLDLHSGAAHGYSVDNGSWKPWLEDVMQGKVAEGGSFVGLSPELWAAGKPTSQ